MESFNLFGFWQALTQTHTHTHSQLPSADVVWWSLVGLGDADDGSLQELAWPLKASECPDEGSAHQMGSVVSATTKAATHYGSTLPWLHLGSQPAACLRPFAQFE